MLYSNLTIFPTQNILMELLSYIRINIQLLVLDFLDLLDLDLWLWSYWFWILLVLIFGVGFWCCIFPYTWISNRFLLLPFHKYLFYRSHSTPLALIYNSASVQLKLTFIVYSVFVVLVTQYKI